MRKRDYTITERGIISRGWRDGVLLIHYKERCRSGRRITMGTYPPDQLRLLYLLKMFRVERVEFSDLGVHDIFEHVLEPLEWVGILLFAHGKA